MSGPGGISCAGCLYHHDLHDGTIECRYDAPEALHAAARYRLGEWPNTQAVRWCGEWRDPTTGEASSLYAGDPTAEFMRSDGDHAEPAGGGGGGGDAWGDPVDADIIPDVDDTRDLGSDAKKFAKLYANLLNDQSLSGLSIENGIVDRSESTLSFTDGTRTASIQPTGANFKYFHQGVEYTSTGATVVIPDTEGLHYIYFNGATLTATTTFSPTIITDYAFVMVVYWDATNNEGIYVGDERHGTTMDSQTHLYNHLTYGARYQDGLSIGDMDVDGNGDDASAAQMSVADGNIWDEDIQAVIADGSPQDLAPIAQIPMYYRSGASGNWRKVAADNYPVANTGAGRAEWNEYTGATWQLTEVDNNDFVLTHLFATPSIDEPIIGIVGQAEYNTTGQARDGAVTELVNLSLGALSTLAPEYVPIATIILQTSNGYSNDPQARVRSTDTGADYIDWRSLRGGGTEGYSYSHPNHSGEVTSTGDGATVVQPAAVTDKTSLATLADADEFLVNDNDASELKRITASAVKTYTGGGGSGATPVETLVFQGTLSSSTLNLNADTTMTWNDSVEHADITHTDGGSVIEVDVAGEYIVDVYLECSDAQNDQRSIWKTVLEHNDAASALIKQYSYSSCYIRDDGAANDEGGSGAPGWSRVMAAGEEIVIKSVLLDNQFSNNNYADTSKSYLQIYRKTYT